MLLRVVGAVLAGLLLFPVTQAFAAENPVIGPARGNALHVMSFNLRYASDSEPNSWPARRPVMAQLLRREQPTVIGTQEGLYGQLKDIERDLPQHYDWIGVGRAGGSRDEFMAIYYDTRRLEPMEFDHYWLSDTPNVVGSKSWGNNVIRMVTWVRFADSRSGRQFVVVNTHFDHESENSRLRSAELVRDRINAIAPGLPVVLTGDFNAAAQSTPTYDILMSGAGLTDTWPAAAERRTPLYATFHGYRPLVPNGPRIDWILTRGGMTIQAAAINTYASNNQFPSDHLPVQALVTLSPTQP
ncbi:endonuclease/exonuclease/phosphatase family protein [Kibdelosporangium aridum]|uniref:Metal-dependent hydrolase, endonuclease/exonuclease/phosphatase family n=1 Tax=Kibdelosporangium aridum TaxID=2030 RepID=A0A1W2FY42_KIBAR|nr:endonuclease/exonuclease/phosphatase family protein [Kibdelosporangium aridum]SMD26566.1 Metal-dependent hydrolase, endonuclease/exonuclease/phosphatase family [Kibdelosporangium aridum]